MNINDIFDNICNGINSIISGKEITGTELMGVILLKDGKLRVIPLDKASNIAEAYPNEKSREELANSLKKFRDEGKLKGTFNVLVGESSSISLDEIKKVLEERQEFEMLAKIEKASKDESQNITDVSHDGVSVGDIINQELEDSTLVPRLLVFMHTKDEDRFRIYDHNSNEFVLVRDDVVDNKSVIQNSIGEEFKEVQNNIKEIREIFASLWKQK